jgi:hypothetical protein
MIPSILSIIMSELLTPSKRGESPVYPTLPRFCTDWPRYALIGLVLGQLRHPASSRPQFRPDQPEPLWATAIATITIPTLSHPSNHCIDSRLSNIQLHPNLSARIAYSVEDPYHFKVFSRILSSLSLPLLHVWSDLVEN